MQRLRVIERWTSARDRAIRGVPPGTNRNHTFIPRPFLADASRCGNRGGRKGFSLFELTIAAILLAAVMVTAIPSLAWIVRTRQGAEREQVALLEVDNLMERITSRDWEEITPEALAAIPLPDRVARQFPEAKVTIDLAPASDPPDAKRVSIELSWGESIAGTRSPPIRLTAWVYRRPKEGP